MDIEPDDYTDVSVNVTFRDCVSRNNMGGGFDIGLKRNNASTTAAPNRPLSILFDNCSVDKTGDYEPPSPNRWPLGVDSEFGGYNIGGIVSGTRGSIVIRNAQVQDTPRAGLFMYDVAPDGVAVSIEGVSMTRVATNRTTRAPASGQSRVVKSAPVLILHECRLGLPYCYEIAHCCAVQLKNISVVDEVDRPWLFLDQGFPVGGDKAVSGTATVTNRFGCRTGGNGSASGVHVTCRQGADNSSATSTWLKSDDAFTVFSTYNRAACPSCQPTTNEFGAAANYSHVFFSPYLDVDTDAIRCPADFAPDTAAGARCLPDPEAFALGSRRVPAGKRALWLPSNPVAMYSTNRPRSSTVGSCSHDYTDGCSPAMAVCSGDGPNASCSMWLDELDDGFVGPWSETWQRLSSARFDWWLARFKASGGKLDWLFSDFESIPGPADLEWAYISQAANGSGSLGSERAIMADGRFASLQQHLVATAAAGGCRWDGQIAGWREWEPTDCRVQAWNAVAFNMTAEALNAAIFRPAERAFPLVKTSDFTHFHTDPQSTGTWAFTADTEQIASSTDGAVSTPGGPRMGWGAHAGNANSLSFYAASKPVLPADEMFVVSIPRRHMAGTAQQEAIVQTVPVTAFNQLILDTRKTRNTVAGSLRAEAASTSPAAQGILAWVAPQRGCDVIGKGYNNSPGIYAGDSLYRESLFHIALSGCVRDFIYYHAWAETPWDVNLDVMSETIAELDSVTALVAQQPARNNSRSRAEGAQADGCLTLSAADDIPWDTPHVVSGATFSGRRLFRVTMRSRPNQTGSTSDHPGAVRILSESPFTFWPTNVARWFAVTPVPGARCLFAGCVRAGSPGVWLVAGSQK